MRVDVAFVPQAAPVGDPGVLVVVDEIRASTTLTTLVEIGCRTIFVAGALATARRLARETGSLLVGERHLRRPPGFDLPNSPTAILRAGVEGRSVVLSTTNGTAVLRRLAGKPHVLVGCLRNARACAAAAADLALADGSDIRVVCAGREGRFVLEDAVAAGAIAARIVETTTARGAAVDLSDGARAAMLLASAYPEPLRALEASDGGRVLRSIGEEEDLPYCAEMDVTDVVPVLVPGRELRIERLGPRGRDVPAGTRDA